MPHFPLLANNFRRTIVFDPANGGYSKYGVRSRARSAREHHRFPDDRTYRTSLAGPSTRVYEFESGKGVAKGFRFWGPTAFTKEPGWGEVKEGMETLSQGIDWVNQKTWPPRP